MTKIKYRGLTKNVFLDKLRTDGKGTRRWVYGYYCKLRVKHYIIPEDTELWEPFVEVDPETVGQYTGLKDKNGKEIYEGDIVKAPAMEPDAICKVIWKRNCWCLEYSKGYTGLTNYGGEMSPEVIGNAAENPELLEEGK